VSNPTYFIHSSEKIFFHAVSSSDTHTISVATTSYSIFLQNVSHFLSFELQSIAILGILRIAVQLIKTDNLISAGNRTTNL
jgi:hypothetical protein